MKKIWYTKCTSVSMEKYKIFNILVIAFCLLISVLSVCFLFDLKNYELSASFATNGYVNQGKQARVYGVERNLLISYDGMFGSWETSRPSKFSNEDEFLYTYHVYKVSKDESGTVQRTHVETFTNEGFEKYYQKSENVIYFDVKVEEKLPKIHFPVSWIAIPVLLTVGSLGFAFLHICSIVTKTKYENGEIDQL
ncbi:MAG: hypothetical protein IJX75_06065 [Clostridia bacterium]|nr:hypothetical protein [Clostridia bacterium]